MSLRPPRQGRERLSAASVVHGELPNLVALFHQCVDIAGTGKRKVDGELAATRLGKPVTVRWANERFRQVMLLIRQFRMEWPNKALLSADDTEFIRSAMDVALSTAVHEGHTGDIYDLNCTTWAIWMVQHVRAVRLGKWTAESEGVRDLLSFENLYAWLAEQAKRGDQFNVRDVGYEPQIRRYKLPFKPMNVPPKPTELFKWKKGSRRLSDWMVKGGFAPIDSAIQSLKPPQLVAAPSLQAHRESRRAAMWSRVAERARARALTSVEREGEDATLTRNVVNSIMSDSRADAPAAMSDADADELERELEAALENPQAAGPSPLPPPSPAPHAGSASSSQSPLSEYELQRMRNVERNQRVLAELGLLDSAPLNIPPSARPAPPPRDPFPPGRSGAAPSRRSTRKRTPATYTNNDPVAPSEDDGEPEAEGRMVGE